MRTPGFSIRLYYALRPLPDGKPSGQASFMDIHAGNGVIEIGYIWFAPSMQRTLADDNFDARGVREAFALCDDGCAVRLSAAIRSHDPAASIATHPKTDADH